MEAIRTYLRWRSMFENSFNQDLVFPLKNAINSLDRAFQVYGDGFSDLIRFQEKIIASPNLLVEIVRGEDEICKTCKFSKTCLVGDFSEVSAAWASLGVKLHSLTEGDEWALKRLELNYGQVYTASSLIGQK